MPESRRGMDQEEPSSTTSINRRAGQCVHRQSSDLFSGVVHVVFPFLRWWTWGMSSRSSTTEEVDSSPRLLLEQTTSTPRCRSGEHIHNRLVSLSLAVVLNFNLHFCCLALMHQENDQSSATAEADGLQIDSAFGTSGIASQNVAGGTEPSLKVNCFYTDMKQLHLHWLIKSFMLYLCTVHGRQRFSVRGPRATDFSLFTMSLWSGMHFTKPHASRPCCPGCMMNVLWFCQG